MFDLFRVEGGVEWVVRKVISYFANCLEIFVLHLCDQFERVGDSDTLVKG